MNRMSGLMLLTSNHTSHNDCWIFNCGHQGIVFCVACALEQLEDPGKPPVKKKFLLTELLKVVVDSDHELLRTLDDEPQVSVHLVSVLIALFASSDDGIIASAIEVIVEVCCQLRNEDLVYGLVNQVTSLCLQDSSFQKSLPSLTLIGRLLQSIPPLADLLQQSYRHFTDYLLTGLKYPEENIQSAITYILLHLAGGHMSNICKEPLVKELIKNLLAIIASASSSELTMNSLGLLKKVVENECSVHEIMATDNYGLASSAFKKVLLSRNGIHQITVVQCLTQLVLAEKSLKQTTFTESLLSADIAEFLFECLATTNDILLSSIFCCLLVLTDSLNFFHECHAVYGMDSVVRATNHAMKLKNKDILCQGLELIKKMLNRQPTNVSLITSSSLLKAMSSLLCRCLRHSQISIVCSAGGALQELLRKDHLKNPVDFNALEQPLRAIMDTWKDIGSLSNLTKTSRSSTASLTSEENKNKRYDENKQCLAVGLSVMERAFRLSILCQRDPTASASIFKAPHSQLTDDEEMIDVEQFIEFLLKMLDTICIPHVMVNYKHLDDAEVCRCFFSILCHVYDISTVIDIKSFSSKLASSSFIQLSLSVKNQFCSQQANCDVKERVDSFLLNLCHNLLPDNDKSCLAKMESVIGDINCPVYDICAILRGQSSMYFLPSSVPPLDLQSTCLTLMYLAAIYGDPLANDIDVFEGLNLYLSSEHCLISDLDQSSLKKFMYLYTTGFNSATLGQHSIIKEKAPASLIRVLEKMDYSVIFNENPLLIQWAYMTQDVPQNIRRGFLVQWLINLPTIPDDNGTEEEESHTESSKDGDKLNRITDSNALKMFRKGMARLDSISRSKLIEDILDVILNEDEAVTNRCLLFIKSIIYPSMAADPVSDATCSNKINPISDSSFANNSSSDTRFSNMIDFDSDISCPNNINSADTIYPNNNTLNSDMIHLLQERLPQIVIEMFLQDRVHADTETKISSLLKLLTEINLKSQDSTSAVELKLVYYVTNMLTKSINSINTKSVIVNYLHCLLFATVNNQDTSVLSILLSNKTLLQLFENLLQEESEALKCSILSLLSSLLELQHQHRQKACLKIEVDIKWLSDLVSTNKLSFQRYTALNFWTTIFKTNFSPDNFIRLREGDRQHELLQDKDMNLHIKTDHLRLLIIHLQNIIMMDSGSESLLAIKCYTSLLNYVRSKDNEQGDILLRQPWNGALVRLLLQVQSPLFISPTLIQLYNMFMSYKFWIEHLLNGFVSLITAFKAWSQISTNAYHMILHIINKIYDYLSHDQKQRLESTIDKSKEQIDQMRNNDIKPKLIDFNSIILLSNCSIIPVGSLKSTLFLVTKKLSR